MAKRKKLKDESPPESRSALASLDSQIAGLVEQHEQTIGKIEGLNAEVAAADDPDQGTAILEEMAEHETRLNWLDARIAQLKSQRDAAAAEDARPVQQEMLRASNSYALQLADMVRDVDDLLSGLERALAAFKDRLLLAHHERTTAVNLTKQHNLELPRPTDLTPIPQPVHEWGQKLRAIMRYVDNDIKFAAPNSRWQAELNRLRNERRSSK